MLLTIGSCVWLYLICVFQQNEPTPMFKNWISSFWSWNRPRYEETWTFKLWSLVETLLLKSLKHFFLLLELTSKPRPSAISQLIRLAAGCTPNGSSFTYVNIYQHLSPRINNRAWQPQSLKPKTNKVTLTYIKQLWYTSHTLVWGLLSLVQTLITCPWKDSKQGAGA